MRAGICSFGMGRIAEHMSHAYMPPQLMVWLLQENTPSYRISYRMTAIGYRAEKSLQEKSMNSGCTSTADAIADWRRQAAATLTRAASRD